MNALSLKTLSLYPELNELFQRARAAANYGLNALPEEEIAAELVEELAPVLVRVEDLIERLSQRAAARLMRAA